jgi:hypothetical protein
MYLHILFSFQELTEFNLCTVNYTNRNLFRRELGINFIVRCSSAERVYIEIALRNSEEERNSNSTPEERKLGYSPIQRTPLASD